VRHTFQSFWWGDTLTRYAAVCLQSFIDRGHAVDLYSFNRDVTVPAGVRVRDARELFALEDMFFYRKGRGRGSPSAFSNLFRYKLLAERGGWWVDTDVVCLARELPPFDIFFARQDENVINCAVLHFPAGHAAMIQCFDEAQRAGREIAWGTTGPRLFTRVLDGLGMSHHALDSAICYPLPWRQALDALNPECTGTISANAASSLFFHLWNEIYRRQAIDQNVLPPDGSFLRKIAERHPVSGWQAQPSNDAALGLGAT
jgi:hypothetical protein